MDYATFYALCTAKNTTPTALTAKLGLSKGNASSWKRGGNPSAEILIKIADELNCTVDVLLGRHTENDRHQALPSDEQALLNTYRQLSPISKARLDERASILLDLEAQVSDNTEKHRMIQIKSSEYKVSAGTGFMLDDNNRWDTIQVPDTPDARKADFALTITGDSMEPIYHDGDVVLVKKQDTVDAGEIGIFVVDGDGYIKKYGGDRLISLNDAYDDILLNENNFIKCCGKVIGRV